MKKIISILIILALIIGVCCGCGGSNGDNGEQVTLVWAIPNAEQSDYQLVLKQVNELLAKKMPNTKIEFKCDTSMSTKWALWMAGQTQIDIALSGYCTDLATEINKKSFYELNDLIKEYAPTVQKEWEDYEVSYQTGQMNGKLYAIPNIQIHINDEVFFSVPEDLYSYFDVAAFQKAVKENPTTTEVFYQIIDQYLAAASSHVNKEKNAGLIGDVQHIFRNMVKRGYELIGGNNSMLCYKVSDDTCKVMNFYETEEYLTYIKYAQKWYSEGYISKDILTGEDGIGTRQALFNANITNFRIDDANHDGIITPEEAKAANSANSDYYKISMTTVEQKYSGTSVIGSLKTYLSIPTTSKNAARAMKLIELLRTKEGAEILNTIVYGIEGTHYDKTSENEIKPYDYQGQGTSSSKYGIPNWEIGNMFNMYVCYPYTNKTVEAARQYFEEELPNFKKTKVYGLSIDNSKVENELSQMSSANEEFMLQMIGGTSGKNYMKTYSSMIAKLKAAGIEKVMKEYQAQIDSYKK